MKNITYVKLKNDGIVNQIISYWKLTKSQFGFNDKKQCENCVMEFLQFNDLNCKSLNHLIDVVYNN